VATLGATLVVSTMIWAAGALLSSSGDDLVDSAANHRTITLASNPRSDPPATGPLFPAGVSRGSSAPSSASSVAATTTVTTTTVTTTSPPGPCPDDVLKLTVTIAQRSYPVGQHPEFTLHIANAGPAPCFRDVSRPLRYLVLAAAGSSTPLWSSIDCYSVPTHEIPLFAPGQQVTSSVVWVGRTSAPGCPLSRENVPAGDYTVTGHLGPLTSPAAPFTLAPSG
jgi:hypothetical protein